MNTKLNSCKGTLFAPSLIDLSEEEITEGLKKHGIIEVVKLTRERDGVRRPTGLHIITFDRFQLPESIRFGFEQIEVREYIPNPMRCRKCQLLGHTIKRCESPVEICATCEENFHEGQCAKTKCVNCKADTHSSKDPKCPEFTKQKEILRIQNKYRCSMYEARKFYYSTLGKQNSTDKPSYADIAKTGQETQVFEFTAKTNANTGTTTSTNTNSPPTTTETTKQTNKQNQQRPTNNTIQNQNTSKPQQQNKKTKNYINTIGQEATTETNSSKKSQEPTQQLPPNQTTPLRNQQNTDETTQDFTPRTANRLDEVLNEHFEQFSTEHSFFNVKNVLNFNDIKKTNDTHPCPDPNTEMETDK